jgi:DNA helicase-2/ATP-dependent DNA helicase PcrA
MTVSLNPRQREAVAHGEGALLLLAGAGSGKTRVLVHRIARLLEERIARPDEILAVTFTNKAARELVDRCRAEVGAAAADLWAGTFHGIGARLLRRHADEIGYTSSFSIFDSDDQVRLLKEIVAELNLDETLFPPEAFRAFIEAAKNDARMPEAVAAGADVYDARAIQVFARYQERLRRLGAMDFGDLIVNVIELFRRCAALLERYQRRFRYVFVDEYQDTNHAQYLMVAMLAAGHGNLCVVGDDDQSIYGWRGASLRNILEFERDFPGAHVVRLEQNYRSTGHIIEAAQAVIANNGERMPKRIWTANPPGRRIRLYRAADERDEARFVVDALLALGSARGGAAVFYRTNAQSRAMEEALVQAGVPYVIVGSTRFYERREIKDLIAYLRFVHNPHDDVSLARIVNVPARGIGRVTWDRMRAAATATAGSLWNVLTNDAGSIGFSASAAKRTNEFVRAAGQWIAMRGSSQVTPLLTKILEDTGYASYLEHLAGGEGASRLENVQELVTVAQNFDAAYDARELDREDPDLGPLATFLEQLALASEVDNYEARSNAVTLMTIHNSKGLEFDHVFVIGMEEGIFPHGRSTSSGSHNAIEEERRLCYVAITRARAALSLVYAVQRHLYGTTQFNFPSRFLEEIPREHLEEARPPQEQAYATSAAASVSAAAERISEPETFGRYRVGMRVVHPMFGVGTVRVCDRSGNDEKLVVHFNRAGVKKLVARFARLEIV